ncbi:MAG TPA: glutamate formimidoyltransferase [Caldilineaceae bacterium]|nr:glutamate formimidoyltransferase [Caldilineaceae bacterium]
MTSPSSPTPPRATPLTGPALVEAVPNFSEGRRPDVVDAIVEAIQAPGVYLLDRSSDWDHNRSVITVAGAPEAVVEGLFRAVRVAALLIDLFQHKGAHPRLGAADVVPIVPIRNITLAECAALARELGRRIGEELELPVYLYEAAALRPERRNLADVRRGEFERLVQEIGLPERAPDFGPARVGPAGAVIVGARPFLIAYNVYLKSADVEIAKAIARAIRASSGGLPAVKAMGVLVDGQAQVSMNLVDYTRTPLHVVMEQVTALARQYGTDVDRSELIGLIPQDAMLQAAAYYLKLPHFDRLRVVENAVEAAVADG